MQYGNGNFRIPDAAEPTDVQCGASVRLADGILIVCWGNISFAVPGEVLDSALASGRELAVKLPLHDPKNITFFCVDDPAWLSDILLDFSMDFLLLGGEKCRIPEKLQQKRKAKYFVGISRGAGWELYWSDGIDFRIGRKSAAGAK